MLHQTITVSMVSKRKVQDNFQCLKQCPPETGDKLHSQIQDYVSRQAIEVEDFFKEAEPTEKQIATQKIR